MRNGLTRVASAPAVLVAATVVLWWGDQAVDPRAAVEGFLLWTFLSGGIIDRYARGRPTRARGFFAACGAHFLAMVRLGLVLFLTHSALYSTLAAVGGSRYLPAADVVLLFLAGIVVYAQILLVVEDRRSAIGSLLAAWRFVRRNPASVVLLVIFAGLYWGSVYAAPAVTLTTYRWTVPTLQRAVTLTVFAGLGLVLYASATVLFQSRLAHVGYTAGPPLEWPESPAAEAIANASRTAR